MAADQTPGPDPAQARLAEALAERDQALTALARAREELEALRLALRERGEPVPDAPASAGELPLRYLLADRANDQVKGLLGPLHGLARRLLARGR